MERVIGVVGVVSMLVSASNAWAERKLTIEETLAIAKKQSRDLRAARSRLEQSSAGIGTARAALLPAAAAQGKYTHNYKEVTLNVGSSFAPFLPVAKALEQQFGMGTPVGDAAAELDRGITAAINAPPAVIQKREQLDGIVSVSVPILAPAQWATLSAAKRTYEAAEATYTTSVATTLVQAAQAFYAAAGTDELIRVRQHAIQVAKETLDNAQARFSTGVVNRVEVTRAELALVRAEQSLVETLDAQSQAYRALATLLDLHEEFHVEPPPAPTERPESNNKVVEEAMRLRPEIAAIERRMESVDAQVSAAEWRWAPTLSAFGNARAFNYVGFSGDQYSWAIGAQVDWVIYDGGLRDAQRNLAEAQNVENAARLELLRDRIADEIANAARAADTKRKALDTATRSVDLSTETLELVRAQHDAGTATQIDLLQAQDALVAAEVAVAQARFDLALADIAFERAAGLFPRRSNAVTSTDNAIDSASPANAARISPKRLIPLAVIALGVLAYFGSRLYIARQPYEWSGTVEARTISVGSRAGGRILDILVKEGERVTAGQPLLTFEPGDLAAQKLMAEGQLMQAQANLEKLQRGSRPEEIEQARARAQTAQAALEESHAGARREQIDAARARLQAAEVTANKAKLDAERVHQLLKRGAASQADADNADAQLNSAIAQRDALKEALDELKNGVRIEELKQAEARAKEAQASFKLVEAGARIEDVAAAQGQVNAAKGKLDQIQVMIDELTVRAPKNARVESLDLRPGDIVAPNATCAVLLEEDQLYVRIYVPETSVGLVKIGQEVPITVDSFPDRKFKGRVEHIATVGEYSPRNLQTADERADQVFSTRVGIVEGQNQLRAGMAAFITVPK